MRRILRIYGEFIFSTCRENLHGGEVFFFKLVLTFNGRLPHLETTKNELTFLKGTKIPFNTNGKKIFIIAMKEYTGNSPHVVMGNSNSPNEENSSHRENNMFSSFGENFSYFGVDTLL